MREQFAGILTEGGAENYIFQYDTDYLNRKDAKAVSLTLPLQKAPHESRVLFPFFDGLIPEGWLLDIAENNWKISKKDRMGLLLTCCKDCIGAVSVQPMED
ncbi:hypothetical protein MmiHf6_02120 [Methanimicrococcus hongohii]|uniref:HipA N-terminal subdomain 1 domain-containing protein n=1 Tax=Methanimicrococcus hongohii TaxID=3028295 RepID=A0AA96V0D1_9EURY|nr:HipA N-terminal domain-containing protein [Methanimicrococcus sp. Hf6]WNY22920.1 hypothetical protein MmiHf6_02120 [Methanimicrococcus sp. Hf6]